jgi:hypothetical protein
MASIDRRDRPEVVFLSDGKQQRVYPYRVDIVNWRQKSVSSIEDHVEYELTQTYISNRPLDPDRNYVAEALALENPPPPKPRPEKKRNGWKKLKAEAKKKREEEKRAEESRPNNSMAWLDLDD